MRKSSIRHLALLCTASVMISTSAYSAPARATGACGKLPGHDALQSALKDARTQNNGGMNNDMWGAVVDRSGTVCAVAFTGEHVGSQWPGSRLISVAKATTANAFSLDGMALSTANLYAASQPSGPLYGLLESNPLNTAIAYKGPTASYGSASDPLVGSIVGGTNVFGGGLALYDESGRVVGGVGVSGDTSCADHNIAWRTRHNMKLDFVGKGVSPERNDQIVYDIKDWKSAGGFGHPTCGGKEEDVTKDLPPVSRTAAKSAPEKQKTAQ